MKHPTVLIIIENACFPFDARVSNEAQALRQKGYRVVVLCPRESGSDKRQEVVDGITVYRHPSIDSDRFGYAWEYACALFWEFLYTWWIFAREGFRVIQGCNPPDTIFLVALPFKLFGVKYIFDHHDVSPELYLAKFNNSGFLYRALMALEKWTFRTSDSVIATNESYRQIAVTRGGLNPNDVFVVRNGPDLQTFQPVAPNPARKHGKSYLVGYVGTMNSQDGLDILIDVAAHIKSLGRTDIHFTCVGSGPALPELRRLVCEKDLDEMMLFTGRVCQEDLLEILSTADVCVNPDTPCVMNDISTMIKIMEYMALGKPIVQFDVREGRVSAGAASLYADKNKPVTDFAEKILYLVNNTEERLRMGEIGRRRVQTELAWQYSISNLLAAYECALSKESILQQFSRFLKSAWRQGASVRPGNVAPESSVITGKDSPVRPASNGSSKG